MRRRAVVVGAGNIGLATGRLWESLGGEAAYWDTSAAVRQSLARYLPFVLARALWEGVGTRCARLAGTALYASGRTETQPTLSELLHRRLRRD